MHAGGTIRTWGVITMLCLLIAGQGVGPATAEDGGKRTPDTIMRAVGQNRFQTAVEVADLIGLNFDEVVVAPVDDPVTALLAGPLAASRGAVVLLTRGEELPAATEQVLRRAQVVRATVVGDESLIGGSVTEALTALGLDVSRVGGSDAVETAVQIAEEMAPTPGGDAFLAATPGDDDHGMGEVLLAATFAARARVPLLLTAVDHLPAVSSDALQRLQPDRVIAVGDHDVLSPGVTRGLRPRHRRVGRLPGTAAQIAADHARQNAPSGPVIIASSRGFADAVTLPALVGGSDGALLLIGDDAADPALDVLPRLDLSSGVVIAGGFGGVDEATGRRIRQAGVLRPLRGKTPVELRSAGGDVLVLAVVPLLLLLAAIRPRPTADEHAHQGQQT